MNLLSRHYPWLLGGALLYASYCFMVTRVSGIWLAGFLISQLSLVLILLGAFILLLNIVIGFVLRASVDVLESYLKLGFGMRNFLLKACLIAIGFELGMLSLFCFHLCTTPPQILDGWSPVKADKPV
ncbi:MAG: hypothetical protein K2W82_13780 [Candidatus Obscuribacterales bacterium]|nr:hypothetical protein [Candidatus Obscuribacterales bacterium]